MASVFFAMPEFKDLDSFFSNSTLGFKLDPPSNEVSDLIQTLPHISKLQLFITFFEMLRSMNQHNITTFSSAIHTKVYGEEEGNRMRNIFGYTLDRFDKSISLNEIAQIANMTPNAFCRYFKQRTNKTYVNFLLDIRIGNACKLLTKNTDFSIAEISYKSGFNNLTNFNRKFKSIKGMTPSEFRNRV